LDCSLAKRSFAADDDDNRVMIPGPMPRAKGRRVLAMGEEKMKGGKVRYGI